MRFVFEPFELLCIYTARWILQTASQGQWLAEDPFVREGLTESAAGAFSYTRHGRRVFTVTALELIGGAFYLLLFAGIVSLVAWMNT